MTVRKKRARPRRHEKGRARRPSRRKPARASVAEPRRYLRIEIDLVHEAFRREGNPVVQRLRALFREREVVEVEGLVRLTSSVLRSLSSEGYRRVDHWEVRPGGWLPLPEPAHRQLAEPVGHLLNALESRAWAQVARARSFAVRVSGEGPTRIDLVVRALHREHAHAVTLELRGAFTEGEVRSVARSLRSALAVARLRTFDHPPATGFAPLRARGPA